MTDGAPLSAPADLRPATEAVLSSCRRMLAATRRLADASVLAYEACRRFWEAQATPTQRIKAAIRRAREEDV